MALCFCVLSLFGLDVPMNETRAQREETHASVVVPKEMQWEPSWRESDDCGQMCLYVLLQLEGRDVSMPDVKRAVPITLKLGSSIQTLEEGCKRLGYSAEVRYVRPEELPSLRFPFIVHHNGSLQTRKGHFTVIVKYSPEKRQYGIIDTDLSDFRWIPVDSALLNYSGYVLVGTNAVDAYIQVAGYVLVGLSVCLAVVFLRTRTSHSKSDTIKLVSSHSGRPEGSI
jgi:hypothetical protein